MKTPRTPPDVKMDDIPKDLLDEIMSGRTADYVRKFNRSYLHWDDLRHMDVGSSDPAAIWALMKVVRDSSAKHLNFAGLDVRYNLTDDCQELLHDIDISSGSPLPPGMDGRREREIRSVDSAMEESIASSQIEGAVTETKDAKTMLREKRRPKNKSEQMIVNNFNAMNLIGSKLDCDLTPEFICDIHSVVSSGTLDDEYVGRFREDDDIVVVDTSTGEVSHRPPEHTRIGQMIDALCSFANSDDAYIHPIVKGIIIHFIFAYIHPFRDGNGRTSRTLFYWFVMKKGYGIMGYLSVSRFIKMHSGKYYRSFMLTETDGNDMTYFISYNMNIITEAMDSFEKSLLKETDNSGPDIRDIREDGLNARQRSIVSDMRRSGDDISINYLRNSYQIAVNTARSDISKLKENGLIQKSSRDGNRVLYSYVRKNDE